MKLNWFSSLPPIRSKIAEYTKQVLPCLSNHADVIIWTEQESWDTELENFAQVYHYHPHTIPWDVINQGDINLYHIDNHPNFQQNVRDISRHCPGLVILHEINLHRCFSAIYLNSDGDLTTLALENSAGVIVHNQKAYNLLKQDKTRFTGYIPLPYCLDYSDYGSEMSQLEQDFLDQNDQIENYVKTVSDFSEMTIKYRPYPLMNQLVEKVVKEIGFLSNNKPLKDSLQTVTNSIQFLIS
jgi:hypothetical protein